MPMKDVEIIRAVRILCMQRRFDEAIQQAGTVQDESSRKTLTAICTSFRNSNISGPSQELLTRTLR
jgi:hypothetical protein